MVKLSGEILWDGRWLKVRNRNTLLPPLGFVRGHLEGPFAWSRAFLYHTPQDRRHRGGRVRLADPSTLGAGSGGPTGSRRGPSRGRGRTRLVPGLVIGRARSFGLRLTPTVQEGGAPRTVDGLSERPGRPPEVRAVRCLPLGRRGGALLRGVRRPDAVHDARAARDGCGPTVEIGRLSCAGYVPHGIDVPKSGRATNS